MLNEECSTLAEDENVERSLQALRMSFKELYHEIDLFSEQLSLSTQAVKTGNGKVSNVLDNADIDDLIAYAWKYIRESKNSIVTFDDHAVQCEAQKKSNKKVSTPRAWMKPPSEAGSSQEDLRRSVSKRQGAIQITQIIPKGIAKVGSPLPQLNNTVAVETMPEVRNIGTNVNFVTQRTTPKRSNMYGFVIPPDRVTVSSRCQSAREQRPAPVVKPRPLVTAPGSTSRRPGKPWGRTFSDTQFKQLFDRFIQMQSEKNAPGCENLEQVAASEQAESVAKTMEQCSPKVSSNEENESLEKAQNREEKGDEADKKEHGGNEKESLMRNQTPVMEEKDTVPDGATVETLGFTSHALPSVSIIGRRDANFKVQQTGQIAILAKEGEENDLVPNDNILYVEMKRGQTKTVVHEDQKETHSPLKKAVDKDLGLGFSKLKLADEKSTTHPATESDESDTALESCGEAERYDQLLIHVPRSACNKAKTHRNKPNKYLDPFIKMDTPTVSRRKESEVLFDLCDDDSSSWNTDEDFEDDDIRVLLNLDENVVNASNKTSLSGDYELKAPKTPQCIRGLLQVSEIPTLRSPPELNHVDCSSSDLDAETISKHHSSTRFLENLRIWQSAVEIQSQNMKMSNELTENLDKLKSNLHNIAEESTKVSRIAENVKQWTAEIEPYGRQSTVAAQSTFGTTPLASLRSKSCECFGCQSTFEESVPRPVTSPSYDHKSLQRAVFQRNPRYIRTIRKIYELGSSKNRPASRPVRDEVANEAAQKFLRSLNEKPNKQHRGSSSSSSPSVCSLSSLMSNGNESVQYEFPITMTRKKTDSNYGAMSSSGSMSELRPSSSDSNSSVTRGGVECEESDVTSFTSNFSRPSDMGEVLSPGELK